MLVRRFVRSFENISLDDWIIALNNLKIILGRKFELWGGIQQTIFWIYNHKSVQKCFRMLFNLISYKYQRTNLILF